MKKLFAVCFVAVSCLSLGATVVDDPPAPIMGDDIFVSLAHLSPPRQTPMDRYGVHCPIQVQDPDGGYIIVEAKWHEAPDSDYYLIGSLRIFSTSSVTEFLCNCDSVIHDNLLWDLRITTLNWNEPYLWTRKFTTVQCNEP